jgi:hypothetical protein
MFWRRSKPPFRPIHGKTEIFVRHCLFSQVSQNKKRFPQFSREQCFHNFLGTLDRKEANVTFILDVARGNPDEHFLASHQTDPVVRIEAGTEALSFLRTLDFVAGLALHPDTMIYFLEDDYLHRPGWTRILREGFSLPNVDYVTLYDHRDKYFFPMYRDLDARLFATPSCHWRTTPSTTNTFAVRFHTLVADLPIHRRFSLDRSVTDDHGKFCRLGRLGRILISSLPGWSTHAEPEYASPCIDWEPYTH